MARNARFVFAETTADFGEGHLASVVKFETAAIRGVEAVQSRFQGDGKTRGVFFAMRIKGRNRDVVLRKRLGLFAIAGIKGFPAAALAEAVNVTLRKNGAKPGFQGTAPVVVAEEGALAAFSIGQTIEFGKEGIGKFLGIGAGPAALGNSACGGTQVSAVFTDEVFPGRLGALHASGNEREILDAEGAQVILDPSWP